ncbi:hypothetical protein CROQUDRAFT_699696, partial [Cronartium quercuum f. sp. fusiforme G11]
QGAHYIQSVPQCFCCWKIGHITQWCKNSPVCNKCMGDHDPISCKKSLPSPPVCCICISHEKIASQKSVNTLEERFSHHPWSNTCPQTAQEI